MTGHEWNLEIKGGTVLDTQGIIRKMCPQRCPCDPRTGNQSKITKIEE